MAFVSGKIQALDGFFLGFPATTGFKVIDLHRWLVCREAPLISASFFPPFHRRLILLSSSFTSPNWVN